MAELNYTVNPSGIEPPVLAKEPKKGWIFAIIAAIVIIAIAVFAYIFFKTFFASGKKPYPEDKILSGIIYGTAKISSASYKVTFTGVSENREPATKSFVSSVQAARQPLFDRDQDKVRDLQGILSKLKTHFYKNKKYPASLSLAGVAQVQQQKYPYSVKNNGADFSLIAEFETGEAVDATLKAGATLVSGKKVSFSDKSLSYFYFSGKAQSPGFIEVINSPYFGSYFPSDYSVLMSISGASQKDGEKINGQLGIVLSAKLGGFSIDADVQGKKIGDNFYILASKFPQLFFSLQGIIGKWIKITPQDMASYGGGYIGVDASNFDSEYQKKKQDAIKTALKIIEIAEKDKALKVKDSAVREKVEGIVAYRYDITIDKNNIVKFYQDAITELQNKYGTMVSVNQATLDYLQGPEFSEVMDYLDNNSSLSVWITPQGIPIKYSYTIKVLPLNAKGEPAERQLKHTIELTLNDVNKKIKIDEPSETISLEDAVVAVSGISREEFVFSQKISQIEGVRRALANYKTIKSSYPSSLNDLLNTSSNNSDKKLLQTIPEGLAYTKSGNNYNLSYQISLPPFEKISSIYQIYKSYYQKGSASMWGLKALNGKNTATEEYLSREAYNSSFTDSDGDKLSNSLEDYLGTDKNKKDTDGDGYSDYEEITSGNNPSGSGRLKSRY